METDTPPTEFHELTNPEDLIGPSELGKLLGRSTKYIKKDASARPHTLPPRFVMPGRRDVLWHKKDVSAWLQALADKYAKDRDAAIAFAREQGITGVRATKTFTLGAKRIGAQATEALEHAPA